MITTVTTAQSSYRSNPARRTQIRGTWLVTEAHDWDDFTWSRLAWLYGYAKATAVARGVDPATQADVAAWNRLGNRSAA